MPVRYDTLVVKGSTSNEIPREAAGGEVVAWAQGHSLASQTELETFVQSLADGLKEYTSVEAVQQEAERVLAKANHMQNHGYSKEGE